MVEEGWKLHPGQDRTPMDLNKLNKTEAEYKAWKIVCEELNRIGVDINTQDRLARAVEAWGELLVDLRVDQSESERSVARQEKLVGYLQAAAE